MHLQELTAVGKGSKKEVDSHSFVLELRLVMALSAFQDCLLGHSFVLLEQLYISVILEQIRITFTSVEVF